MTLLSVCREMAYEIIWKKKFYKVLGNESLDCGSLDWLHILYEHF